METFMETVMEISKVKVSNSAFPFSTTFSPFLANNVVSDRGIES